MARYVILAQSNITAKALDAWLMLIGEESIPEKDQRRIIWHESTSSMAEKVVVGYEALVRKIKQATVDTYGTIPLNEVVVLVDMVCPTDMNPLKEDISWKENDEWNPVLAMLILSFPEIRWVFGLAGRWQDDGFPVESNLFSLLEPRRDPLFDAMGLRDFIRSRMNKLLGLIGSNLSLRESMAASIDEEMDYTLFNAYTAYRFGYRGEAITSWALMEHHFGPAAKKWAKAKPKPGHGFDLLLEDVNINFPDKPGGIHLSTFQSFQDEKNEKNGRAEYCPLLGYDDLGENCKYRIIVSSGQSGADPVRLEKNEDYIRRNRPDGFGFVLKPIGGMFDLWKKARLFTRLDPKKGSDIAGSQLGQAPGYYWPPSIPEDSEYAGEHSAPGRLMLIARNLIRRANALLDSARTVEECIRGAVLATDALELLRYQTPTLALQALSLKHEFEVRAEVAFLGVGHHFDIKSRFDELEREVVAASFFFQKRRRRPVELDALVSIGSRLMLVFRLAGQFDEEFYCLARIRNWHRKLRMKLARNPLELLPHVVMSYAEWLLVSPARFVGALLVWYLALLGLWMVVGPHGGDLLKSASSAWNTFVSSSPADADTFATYVLNIVAIPAGLFHLGVFISYLYSVVTRK